MSELNTIIIEPDWLEKHGTFILTLLGLLGGGASGLIMYFLKSRCSNIKLCWGAVSCIREPLPADMIEVSAAPRIQRQTNEEQV